MRYRIVDVFSDRPLAGNALCVVLDECDPSRLQALAREVNLSETTFPRSTGERSYDVRIFAPSSELPFAGHPTLGTAWTMAAEAQAHGRWTQSSPGATVTVEVDADGARMKQPVPELTATASEAPVAAAGLGGAIGCWVAEAAGFRHLLLATDRPIGDLSPDLQRVAAVGRQLDTTTFAVIERLDDRTLHVRVFVPSIGVPEDPGTGSAAGPIGVLARQIWGTDATVRIHQGDEIGRPSRIDVEVQPDGPVVGGRVALCAEGRFTL
jgi:trans-2,3-dihydro-3-hydroxyanthranilate isomerase